MNITDPYTRPAGVPFHGSAILARVAHLVSRGWTAGEAMDMALHPLTPYRQTRADTLASTLDTWQPSREASVWGDARTQWRRHWQSLRADASSV